MFAMVGLLLALLALAVHAHNRTFRVGAPDQFLLDGVPFRVVSSSVHYFRVPRALWRDRLVRVRAMGCNAIQTYVPWNWHEPQRGHWDFTSPERDLDAFLALCQELGLLVLLRPGPYICGEWEWGGMPWHLALEHNLTVRTYNDAFVSRVSQWWAVLFALVRPHLIQSGGPVVMVQMENEFGHYGDVVTNAQDRAYMEFLIAFARQHLGPDVVLYTTDGPTAVAQGSFAGSVVLTLVDYGPRQDPDAAWALQRVMNPPGLSPRMCTEYYVGWLDTWGNGYQNRSTAQAVSTLNAILASNASVNVSACGRAHPELTSYDQFYMGFGGTNVGFWNGADYDGTLWSNGVINVVTQSYDYNAPVSESGSANYGPEGTNKFTAISATLAAHGQRTAPLPPVARVFVPRPQRPRGHAALVDNLAIFPQHQLSTDDPVFMEWLGQSFGYTLYTRKGPHAAGLLVLPQVNDRVHVFVDGALVGSPLLHNASQRSVYIPAAARSLGLMVENLGRVNFGPTIVDQRKGLSGPVTLRNVPLQRGWSATCVQDLSAQRLAPLAWNSTAVCMRLPCFWRYLVAVHEQGSDLFVRFDGWGKGSLIVNGVHVGRYWATTPPQRTIWVAATFLTANTEIILFETDVLHSTPPPLYFSASAVWSQ